MDDKKKEPKEKVEIEMDYYKDWIEGAERIKKILHLESDPESVNIGEKRGPIKVTEECIEITENIRLHEIPVVIQDLKRGLNYLLENWNELLEKVNGLKPHLENQRKLEDLIEEKKKMMDSAKNILEWIDEHIRGQDRIDILKQFEDPPFEELKLLAGYLKEGESREPIDVTFHVKF